MDVLLKNAITDRKALRVENHRLDSQLFEATRNKQEMIAEEQMISAEINVSHRFNFMPKHLLGYMITGYLVYDFLMS